MSVFQYFFFGVPNILEKQCLKTHFKNTKYLPFSERKKFRLILYIEVESKVAAYIVFETGHTFDPSKSSPCIYRSMITT